MGDKGRGVIAAQLLLDIKADGYFGPITKKSVESFQEAHGLAVDGVIAKYTWWALTAGASNIRKGDKGMMVKFVQCLLGVVMDGSFGPITDSVVRSFQKTRGLVADGIVGPKTWSILLESDSPDSSKLTQPCPVDYKQFSSKWGSVVYSKTGDKNQTIRSSGCGPAAAADIVATWMDPAYTPVEACSSSVAHGFRTQNDGTARAFFDYVAGQYPFSKYKRTASTDAAIQALRDGALIVALMGPGYWTSGGHYICLWQYDVTSGMIYANDPGSSTRNKASAKVFREQSVEYFIYWR